MSVVSVHIGNISIKVMLGFHYAKAYLGFRILCLTIIMLKAGIFKSYDKLILCVTIIR
jgi:hypothetical protein